MSDASGEYVHGEMNVDDQKATFSGFLTATAWSSLIILMAVGYATFTITMGVNWLVALVGFALFGIVAGLAMSLGSAWILTVVALCVVALFVQLLVSLGGALMS
ncbi:MAG: aa3-type cytochrome c oxidase subunit IV [Hirschia sp.]|nr:aa3-type cytochrome c oxidase subunit IV [Hirschia sp.]MBF19164.1 aa3-type cytochrome c oxidase subunit IV [Hirschia sp.]|tara:strand:+ start:53 stop:364 length:312 start_codon:yes stop_codon:yes gene_type:complete